jgi:predicted transcriptional regulator
VRKIIQNKFIQMWLIIGIIAGFAAVIFFSITYLNERILCDMDCRAKNEVSLILVLLSLFGMFIGSLTYYFISEKYQKKIDRIHKDVNLTLRFLEGEERAIVNSIISRKGKINQSDLVKDTGLSRVKISRSLMRLEQKDIIKKSKNGMTNIVDMNKNLKRIFF